MRIWESGNPLTISTSSLLVIKNGLIIIPAPQRGRRLQKFGGDSAMDQSLVPGSKGLSYIIIYIYNKIK